MTSLNSELSPIEETTPITEILERNVRLYGDDVCLVEINPEVDAARRITWKDFDLVESSTWEPNGQRRSTTWAQFNSLANRFANLLLSRGLKKGDKVGILLMNCLEWLPIYFGALKAGGIAVPLNFRYASDLPKSIFWFSDPNLSDAWNRSPTNLSVFEGSFSWARIVLLSRSLSTRSRTIVRPILRT